MRKLLSLLGSVLLTNTAVVPVVSFSTVVNSDENVDKSTKFYSLVTAQAIKGAILNDQELEIRGDKKASIDMKYASNYFGLQKIMDVFGNLYAPNQGGKPGKNDVVSTYYKSVFGESQDVVNWTLADNFPQLVRSNGLKENTNLWKMANNKVDKDHPINTTKPDQDVQQMISAVIGGAKVVLGNDFSSGLASLAVDLLKNDTIASALNSDSVKDIFKTIDGILTNNQESIVEVLNALTQSNVSEDITFKDKLISATNNVFEALIYLTTSKADATDKTKTTHLIYDDESKLSPAKVFWDLTLNSDKTGTKEINEDSSNVVTPHMISSVAKIVDFAMTLINYFRAFDDEYKIPLYSSSKGTNLFSIDSELTNAMVKAKVNQEKYINDSSKYWYIDKTDNKHYMKFNLQNLSSDLWYYLSPRSGKGYELLRSLNILFGGVAKGSDADNAGHALNPIVDTALSPLLSIATDKITSVLKTLSSIPIIGDKIPKSDDIANLLSTTTSDLFDWFVTDGFYSGKTKTYIKSIASALKLIPDHFDLSKWKDSLGSSYDTVSTVLKIMQGVGEYLNSSNGTSFIERPWSTLYSGKMFSYISNNSYVLSSNKKAIRKLFWYLGELGDIRTILEVKPISGLVETISEMLGLNITLPDWLYSLKDYKISTLMQYFGTNIYHTDAANTLSQNQNYSISTEAISDIVNSLIAHKDNEKDQLRITATDSKGVAQQVSPIWPIFYAIIYNSSDTTIDEKDLPYAYSVKLPNEDESIKLISPTPFADSKGNTSNVNKLALNYLLGVMTDEKTQVSHFTESTIFSGISKLYGHGYTGHEDYTDMSNGAQSIFKIANWFSDLATESIKEVVHDFYDRYFDEKNWRVLNMKSTNLHPSIATPDTVQYLEYDIYFMNPSNGKTSKYHVHLTRFPYKGNNIGWVVDTMMRN